MPLPRKRKGSPAASPPRPLAQSTEAERAEALEKLKSEADRGEDVDLLIRFIESAERGVIK